MAATQEKPQEADATLKQKAPLTVLLALDESEYSQKALEYYVEHLHKPSSAVTVAHCLEMPYLTAGATQEVISQVMANQRNFAKKIEKKYIDMLAEKGVKCNVLFSDFDFAPGHFIVQTAEKEKASLIVIGSRGQGTIRRTIMGSVSDYVVHHAHCPVLVCKQ